MGYNKRDDRSSIHPGYILLCGVLFGILIASFVISIIALTEEDKDTQYAQPNLTAITPYSSALFNTKLYNTASNSPNVTIMLEIKGNDVTLQFPVWIGNCSDGAPSAFIYTDIIPEDYLQVDASDPSSILFSPHTFFPAYSNSSVQALGLAFVDTDGILYLRYDYLDLGTWAGVCSISPFTMQWFKNSTY
jgi:hypothetical protein